MPRVHVGMTTYILDIKKNTSDQVPLLPSIVLPLSDKTQKLPKPVLSFRVIW